MGQPRLSSLQILLTPVMGTPDELTMVAGAGADGDHFSRFERNEKSISPEPATLNPHP
jgi:hypothetical protein